MFLSGIRHNTNLKNSFYKKGIINMGGMRGEDDFLICQLILNECSNDKVFGEVGIIGFKNPPIQISSVLGATKKNEFYLRKLDCKIFDNLYYCPASKLLTSLV
jgi:hypothetical protein